jgi:hypothetical protein
VRSHEHCCKHENIDPRNPTRVPLLFALDEKLNVPGGAVYHQGSKQLDALRTSADRYAAWARSNSVAGLVVSDTAAMRAGAR